MSALPLPQPLGHKRTFGFGDRLGLATAGHLAAVRKTDFAPVFALQSMRELSRSGREAADVLAAAQRALAQAGYTGAWGAETDHLKTPEDLQYAYESGFTMYGIDPVAFVVGITDSMPVDELEERQEAYVADGVFPKGGAEKLYLGKAYEVSPELTLRFTRETLLRAAVKFGRALAHCEMMAKQLKAISHDRPYELGISLDETPAPTAPIEHLFFALELERRKVKVCSISLHFVGEMERGTGYHGDLGTFTASLEQHVAIARAHGPYKICVQGASEKFSILPILARVCGDLLYVRTSGTSYLEGLRVIVRQDPALFREILECSISRYASDRMSYTVSTTEDEAQTLRGIPDEALEAIALDERIGRQVLYVTFGSVLSECVDSTGTPFLDRIHATLEQHLGLYTELLENYFDRHFKALEVLEPLEPPQD